MTIINEKNFSPDFEVVGCFVEWQGKIIILKRHHDCWEGGKWGIPGGKIEKDETAPSAIVRELSEETGLAVDDKKIFYIDNIAVDHDGRKMIYHLFSTVLNQMPNIIINQREHLEYKIIDPLETLKLNLVSDLDYLVQKHYGRN